MRPTARRAAVIALATVFALAANAAAAHVPHAKAVARAAAKLNRDAGRGAGTQLEVALVVPGEEEALATGELLVAKDGRARLELRHASGEVDRQWWRGARREASEADARPLLPPLQLLQARSSGELQQALSGLGGRSGHVVLGHEGVHDAWVLGGRDGQPAVWIDNQTHAIVRIDFGAARARFRWSFPPNEDAWPEWIELESEGATPLRLEIRGEKPAQIPADAFADGWLTR